MEMLSFFFLFRTGFIPLHSVALSLLCWIIMTLNDCKVTKGEKKVKILSLAYVEVSSLLESVASSLFPVRIRC